MNNKEFIRRGIYLVANRNSQGICENLIYSIRASGCFLPIRIIHFGGDKINSEYILSQVEFLQYNSFPDEAKQLIAGLRSVLTDCPLGFLYRYLAWFSDWDEFIYADNDIVALCNWDILFDYLKNNDLVHADEEYKTKGIFNYNKPDEMQLIFGEFVLQSAITAGHIVVKRNDKMVQDIYGAIDWFKKNPHVPQKHDQALLHIASLLGNWHVLNLCKPPYNWLSSWAGDYKNQLQLIQAIQLNGAKISHIHYSGGDPKGNLPIQDLLFSAYNADQRLNRLALTWLRYFLKCDAINHTCMRAKQFLKRGFALQRTLSA